MDEGHQPYPTEHFETFAEAPGLRIRIIALGRGQCVPWHRHTQVTDTFFCMRGPMRVQTREPDGVHVLEPGGTCSVEPGRPHRVSGVDDQRCRFMVIQGMGTYDYVPEAD